MPLDFFGAVAAPLFFILLAFALLALEGKNFKSSVEFLKLGIRRGNFKAVAFDSALLFFVLIAIGYAVSVASTAFGVNDLAKVTAIVLREQWYVLAIVVAFSPIAEEMLFRGYLQSKIGLWASALAFASLHYLYGSIAEVAGALLMALALGAYASRKSSIWPCILAHAAFNAFGVASIVG